MFGAMPAAIGGAPFEWSGDFSQFGVPANHSQLVNWLGIDGQESNDITLDAGFGSHLYLAEDWLPNDVGINLGASNMGVRTSGANVIVDGDFGAGRLVQRYLQKADYNGHQSVVIPATADGTTSMILVAVGKIHAGYVGDGDINRSLWSGWSGGSGIGWVLRYHKDLQRFGMMILWGAGATNRYITGWANGIYGAGDIFCIMAKVDFNEGVLQCIDDKAGAGAPYVNGLVPENNFGPVIPTCGWTFINGWDGLEFQWPLMAAIEFSDQTASGFGEGNMTRFLKFADGVLS